MIKSLYDIFKSWAEKGSVWLIGDTHFGDADCKLMDPEWPEPRKAVKMINKCVKKQDTIIILGDVGNPKYVNWIRALHKVLILGNHDRRGELRPYFDEIYSGPLFISDRILLSHEPVHGLPFCLNIHGHDHNGADNYDDNGHYLNLASNVCGYTPVNLNTIIKDGALSGIDTIHRMAIDGAIARKEGREKSNIQVEDGEILPDICSMPGGAERIVIGFENCEVASVPAELFSKFSLVGNREKSVIMDDLGVDWGELAQCENVLLCLKPEADLPGSKCGLDSDCSLFTRVSMCPDICNITILYEEGEEITYTVPWEDDEKYRNPFQNTVAKDGSLYVSIVSPEWQGKADDGEDA